ncbi:hypothetical protein AB4672_13825 [Bacillus paralicheniformis]|uniref:hypothetical protein n=1 Tax=Bacillus paralicheniformis TaxID=1648923 RepID=UPI0034D27153
MDEIELHEVNDCRALAPLSSTKRLVVGLLRLGCAVFEKDLTVAHIGSGRSERDDAGVGIRLPAEIAQLLFVESTLKLIDIKRRTWMRIIGVQLIDEGLRNVFRL